MLFFVVFHVGYKPRKNVKKGSKSLKDHEELEPGQKQLIAAEEFCVAMKARYRRLILAVAATL